MELLLNRLKTILNQKIRMQLMKNLFVRKLMLSVDLMIDQYSRSDIVVEIDVCLQVFQILIHIHLEDHQKELNVDNIDNTYQIDVRNEIELMI